MGGMKPILLLLALSIAFPSAATADPCVDGPDDTAVVQAAMTAGVCLPPGAYNINPPPLVGGRRRDAMLIGGTLCGVRDDVLVRFRGSANQLAWFGVNNADIHNIVLDSACLTGTVEQNHLIRITESGHTVRDVKLNHPKRPPAIAGDDINVLAAVITSPIAGPVIDHVEFASSCARFAVQITRGVIGGRVSNSTFASDCAIGSEGDGNISGMTFDHLEFAAPLAGVKLTPALNIQNMTDTTFDHITAHGRSFLLYRCERTTLQHSSVDGLVSSSPFGDWISALSISTMGHDIVVTDVHLTQTTVAATPVISVGPVRPNYQADLSNILITYSNLVQGTTAPVVRAEGVNGLTLSNSMITLASPSVPIFDLASVATSPAVSVPSANIVQSGNTLIPYP